MVHTHHNTKCNIHLFGPNYSGKGFSVKKLKHYYGPRLSAIGIGELVRNELKKPEFAAQYAAKVARRELIPDPVVFSLAQRKLNELPDTITIVTYDGICRNHRQVEEAEAKGLFDNSLSIVFHASESTLRARWEDRRTRQPDGPRPDDESESAFLQSIEVYRQNWEHVHNRLRHTGTIIKPINADRDLDVHVLPDLLSHVQWFVDPTPPTVMHKDSTNHRHLSGLNCQLVA